MTMPQELEELYESDEALDETDESMEAPESDEAFDEARRGYGRRVAPARPSVYIPPIRRGGPRPVTQAVLEARLAALRAELAKQIQQNSTAIRRVDAKAIGLANEQVKLRKDVRDGSQRLRKDLNQTREMSAVLPMLTKPSSRALDTDVANLRRGEKVLLDTDGIGSLLPLLLLGGLGSSQNGSGSGGLFGSDSSSSLLMVLLLSQALGK